MSNVSRYQKYWVSDDKSHSLMGSVTLIDSLKVKGHSAHGRVCYLMYILIIFDTRFPSTEISYPEWLDQVIQAPCNDDIVITTNKQCNQSWSQSDASQTRVNHIPNKIRPFPKVLSNAKLQKEQWHSLQEYHQKKWNNECSYTMSTRLHFANHN